MNKYAALGLMIEAEGGARIAVMVRTGHLISDALAEFEAVNADGAFEMTVRRANGAEEVRFPTGGRIIFTTPRSARLRGHALDVVFIDNDAHRVLERDDHDPRVYDRFREDVAMALISRAGKVVHS